jgi:hypothetical protein
MAGGARQEEIPRKSFLRGGTGYVEIILGFGLLFENQKASSGMLPVRSGMQGLRRIVSLLTPIV